jgi:hypothetical protein
LASREHFKQAHYGCEDCDVKLDGKDAEGQDADTVHMLGRSKDPSIFQATSRKGPTPQFEIGMALYSKMKAIYKDKKLYNAKRLTHEEKWVKWWRLFSPGALEADIPDPLYYDQISISTAHVPLAQNIFLELWDANHVLPALDTKEKQDAASTAIRTLLSMFPTIEKYRHLKPSTPQTPQGPSVRQTTSTVVHARGRHPLPNDKWDFVENHANGEPFPQTHPYFGTLGLDARDFSAGDFGAPGFGAPVFSGTYQNLLAAHSNFNMGAQDSAHNTVRALEATETPSLGG